MNPFDDDSDEMPRMHLTDEFPLDEQRIEAILAGTAGAEHAAMSAFVADVRDVAVGPTPVPSAALASVFTHGFSTESGDLSATTASNVTGPATQAAGLPKWRQNIMDIKKYVAGLSIAGKIVLGAGFAAAASGGAGTAGALPDPIQHQFARVLDPIVPFDLPDPEVGPGNEVDGDDPSAVVDESPSRSTVTPTTSVAAAPTTTSAVATTVPAVDDPSAPTTVGTAPTMTVTPGPTVVPAAGVESLSLSCQQNAGWTGVVCRWSMPGTGSGFEVYLLKTGPGAAPSERVWGDDPTSYVDVHADGTNTYTYRIEVRTADGSVVGRSGTVTVTMVPVGTASTTPGEPAPTTAPAEPASTAVPAATVVPSAGVESLSLSCQQNAGWTGVVCRWSMPGTGSGFEVFLLKTGPGAAPSERIWGDDPTSYVDVHADGTNTYTYRVEVRTADGSVVGRSGTVTVTMVPV